MLKEVTQYVFDRAVESAKKDNLNKVNFLDRLCDPRTIVYEMNGTITERPIKPELRDHQVDSVGDLIAAAKKWGGKGVVWLSRAEVVLLIDDEDRRETVTLPLGFSTVFAKVQTLENQPNLDQAGLIRLLRREFRKSPSASILLAAVRKMKFSQRQSGHSEVQHGNESMGHAIEAEVTGADDIADSLLVPTNIYRNPGEEDVAFTVTLDLELNLANRNQPFLLRPMPDDVDAAIATALDSIKDRLVEGTGLTVLYGTP